MALPPGRVLSSWFPGRPHSVLVMTCSFSLQTPGDWTNEERKQYEIINAVYKHLIQILWYIRVKCLQLYLQLHEGNEEVWIRTFIILSLHFLPEESTSTLTVFRRRQNSCRDTTTVITHCRNLLSDYTHTHWNLQSYCHRTC